MNVIAVNPINIITMSSNAAAMGSNAVTANSLGIAHAHAHPAIIVAGICLLIILTAFFVPYLYLPAMEVVWDSVKCRSFGFLEAFILILSVLGIFVGVGGAIWLYTLI